VPKLSASYLVLLLALSCVWAVLGYRLSENDRRTLGRTPWGLPSLVWALFWFLSLVVGLVLYLIAHAVGVRRAQQMSGGPVTPSVVGMAPNPRQSASDLFPAYPRPANVHSQPTQAADRGNGGDGGDSELSAHAPMTDGMGGQPQSPPAWHPDPSGRFHYRWWDGAQWTSHVSTDGHLLVDTNPDQRIGPY
jgi:Protein of unknown function (DUF2510)